jgi:hypothetical protein
MLQLHYKDLLHLRKILSQDQDTRVDHMLAVVDAEIDKVPMAMRPQATRTKESDIYLLTERQVEDRLRVLSYQKNREEFSMLIYCPHHIPGKFMFDRIMSLLQTGKYNIPERWVELANGAKIWITSGEQAESRMRGMQHDLWVVLVPEYDGPSA